MEVVYSQTPESTNGSGCGSEIGQAFDIERARLYFKGTALDERLTYFYHLDGDTDGRHTVDFFDLISII